jgi:dihydroorotase
MLFKNARLIDPASGHDDIGDIRIRDGLIVEIANTLEQMDNEAVHECADAVIAPALIDMRCWVNPQSRGAAGLDITANAAISGGIGTVVVAADSGKGLSSPEDFAPIDNAALTSPVRFLNAGLAVDSNNDMGEIRLMVDAGAVLVGDGGTPIKDTRLTKRVLTYASSLDIWVGISCEDSDLARRTCATEGDLSMRLGLPSRPALSERLAIERSSALAELTGTQILFDRVTTRDGLDALANARKRGLDLAASAPITHFMFNEIDIGGFDARFRLDPPLRSEEDRQALIDAVRNNDIDVIVSDHRACTGEDKAHPFPDAAAGSANLECLLSALVSLSQSEDIPLIDVLRPVTSRPAELLGLPNGQLQPGAPADLVIFNADAPIQHRSNDRICAASSAFDQRRLFAKTLMTLVEGVIVFQPEG